MGQDMKRGSLYCTLKMFEHLHEFKGLYRELKHHTYVRTKPQVTEKINEVKVKKAVDIYNSIEDVLKGPSDRPQICNTKA